MGNGRVALVSGQIVAEEDAQISIFCEGFVWGSVVYDTARTFGGRPLMFEEHVARLLKSCKYVGLDPVYSADEWVRLSREVTERNLPTLGSDEDFWVTQRVVAGVQRDGFPADSVAIIECRPLMLRDRAHLYRDGVELVVSAVRRTPPWAQSPQAKVQSHLNTALAEREVRSRRPGAWPLLLDENGNLAEGSSSNVFIVRDGELLTPHARYVLPGISRATVMRLASELGITCREADIGLYEASGADEAFVTATSLCLCPVVTINSYTIGNGNPWGPLTSRILEAYNGLVGIDIRAQYLAHLDT